MVLYFVMDVFRDLPGLPGLFVACLFSGALRYFRPKSSGVYHGLVLHLKSEGDYVDFISVGLLTAPSRQPLTPWQQ